MVRRGKNSLCQKCGLEIFITPDGYKLDFPDNFRPTYSSHSCEPRGYVIEEIKQIESLGNVTLEQPSKIINPYQDELEILNVNSENYNCPHCGFPNKPKLESCERVIRVNESKVIACNGCGMKFFSDRNYDSGEKIYNDENFIEAWNRFDLIPGLRQKNILRGVKVNSEFLENNSEFLSRAKLQIETGKEISKERERLKEIKNEETKKRARERYQLNKEKKKRVIDNQKEKNFQETGFRETNIERGARILRKIALDEKIEVGCIIEIHDGAFRGNCARVIRVNESKEQVTVELENTLDAAVPIELTVRADQVILYDLE